MSLLCFNHIGVTVSDIERSLAFYRDVLGLELLGRQERDDPDLGRIVGYPGARIKMAFLRPVAAAEPVLELLEVVEPRGAAVDPETKRPGAVHLTFTVQDLRATYAALVPRGVRFLSEPVQIETGVNRGAWSVYLLDPDGVRLALFEPPPGGAHHGLR
jgi:catechol 2,3-dioxygenase-like lactoylglutathione lyase family enzyme